MLRCVTLFIWVQIHGIACTYERSWNSFIFFLSTPICVFHPRGTWRSLIKRLLAWVLIVKRSRAKLSLISLRILLRQVVPIKQASVPSKATVCGLFQQECEMSKFKCEWGREGERDSSVFSEQRAGQTPGDSRHACISLDITCCSANTAMLSYLHRRHFSLKLLTWTESLWS